MSVTALTADDLLTTLSRCEKALWPIVLDGPSLKVLRQAADLCGVGEADTMSRNQAVKAIVENF